MKIFFDSPDIRELPVFLDAAVAPAGGDASLRSPAGQSSVLFSRITGYLKLALREVAQSNHTLAEQPLFRPYTPGTPSGKAWS